MKINNILLERLLKVQDNDLREVPIVALCHFYNPIGCGDWYAVSAKLVGDDVELYGVVYITNVIWAKFRLSELRNMILPFDERVKFDHNFKPTPISKILLA